MTQATPKNPDPAKASYHHGNLREALVQAGIAILESEGLKSLSLRRIAREVGVSQAAPYSHFSDKNDLLVSVCAAGYSIFVERMRLEAKDSQGPAYIAGLGRGYIYFAIENPALFELMFSGNPRDNPEGMAPFADPIFSEGYRLLEEGLKRYPLQQFGHDGASGRHLSPAIAWGVVHGIAGLLLGQRMTPERFGYESLEDYVEETMKQFVGIPLSN